jgi:hypothetical protein
LKKSVKVLGSVVLATLMLAGCSTTPKDVGVAPKQSAETPVKVTTPQLNKADYVAKLVEYSKELSLEFTTFGKVSQSKEAVDDAWIKTNIDQINKIKAVTAKYALLNAPDEMKTIHEEYLTAVSLLSKAVTSMSDALTARNTKDLQLGYTALVGAQDQWNYAYALLQTKADVSIGGDGTVTSDDLKDLDKSAGIDRESVLTNISKDGKELVGKWGNKNKDGSVGVSIVLNENGSYEGYKNGVYPDKADVTLGKWSYNYLTRIISITNEESFKAGAKETISRPQMKMDIEFFKDGQIQMMDTESQNRFKYSKGK